MLIKLFISIITTNLVIGNIYTNQNNWADTCQRGTQQSPINFSKEMKMEVSSTYFQILKVSYGTLKDIKIDILNDKSHINIDPNQHGSIYVRKNEIDYRYNLTGIKLHGRSEHTFEGIDMGLEMHLIHEKDANYTSINFGNDPDTNRKYLIIALLFNETGTNQDHNNLIPKENVELKLNSLFNYYDSFFHYEGSFTYPDCSETVNWVVMSRLYIATDSLISFHNDQIKQNFPTGNRRNIVPLNNRTVYYTPKQIMRKVNNGDSLNIRYFFIFVILILI